MTPLNRAAEAIINELIQQDVHVSGEEGNLSSVPVDGVIDAAAVARAVLAVIRAPGSNVLHAGSQASGLGAADMLSVWVAMIDAALEEG